MRTSILIVMLVVAVAVNRVSAKEQNAQELAQKGYTAFRDVLTGDEARLPEAIQYMEAARKADETSVPNLFNLARAYFFDGITFNNNEVISKAEEAFRRVIELDPSRVDALSFHGAILAQMSRGQDMAMFMRGAQELKTAGERDPNDITVRIVKAFTAQNLPPEALALIGYSDPVANVKFIGRVFDSFSSDFAPHASVVMNAFIGEAYMAAGDKEKALASFESALKVPKPDDAGQLAGREPLDKAIRARMNGGDRSVSGNPAFSGCHSCHLGAPEKLLPR